MTRPGNQKGSVISAAKNPEKSRARNKQLIVLLWISALLFLITVIILISSYLYASRQGEISAWMTYYSEQLSSLAGYFIGGQCAVSIVALCCRKDAWCKGFTLSLSITLLCCVSGGALAVGSAVNKKPEETTVVGPVQTIPKADTGLLKKPYIQEDDFFMTDIEAYLGVEAGSIPSDDFEEHMAVLLIDTLQTEKQKAEREKTEKAGKTAPPSAYVTNTILAEQQHETYKYQRDRDWDKRGETARLLRQERKDDLQDSILARVNANYAFRDSGNMQQIAMYHKEYGDECKAEGDTAAAMAAYKEGSIWSMRAFSSAWVSGTDTSVIMSTFASLDQAVKSDDFANMEARAEIHRSYEAYQIAVKSQ